MSKLATIQTKKQLHTAICNKVLETFQQKYIGTPPDIDINQDALLLQCHYSTIEESEDIRRVLNWLKLLGPVTCMHWQNGDETNRITVRFQIEDPAIFHQYTQKSTFWNSVLLSKQSTDTTVEIENRQQTNYTAINDEIYHALYLYIQSLPHNPIIGRMVDTRHLSGHHVSENHNDGPYPGGYQYFSIDTIYQTTEEYDDIMCIRDIFTHHGKCIAQILQDGEQHQIQLFCYPADHHALLADLTALTITTHTVPSEEQITAPEDVTDSIQPPTSLRHRNRVNQTRTMDSNQRG